MKVEPQSTDVDGLDDLCRRAAQILVTHETRRNYPNGFEVLDAEAIAPTPPSTRDDATPHILLVGPFQDDPDLAGVAIYAGIGFIAVRNIDGPNSTYTLSAIDGDGQDVRVSYLEAALHLYFNDVKFHQTLRA